MGTGECPSLNFDAFSHPTNVLRKKQMSGALGFFGLLCMERATIP